MITVKGMKDVLIASIKRIVKGSCRIYLKIYTYWICLSTAVNNYNTTLKHSYKLHMFVNLIKSELWSN